jgi:hypothetical protein
MAITRLTTLGIAGFAALAFVGLTLVPGGASAGAITGLANADQASVHLVHHKGYKRHKGHHGAHRGGHHKKHNYGHNGGHRYKKHGGHHGHKKHHGLGHLLHGLLGGYNNHGGGHHKSYGYNNGHYGGSYSGGYGGGHKKHRGGYAKQGYARGCHQVTKQVRDDYGYRKTIAGTMCYDHYGQPYIVKGSRYVVGGGHSY